MDKELEYTDEIEAKVAKKDELESGVLEPKEKETDSETDEVSGSDIINASNEDIDYAVDEDPIKNNVISGIYLCEENNDTPNTESDDSQLEAELRTLRSDLQFNTSEYGDWRMAKAMESLLIGINNSDKNDVVDFVKEWAKDTYDRISGEITTRIEKRGRINEIQDELEKMSVNDTTEASEDNE